MIDAIERQNIRVGKLPPYHSLERELLEFALNEINDRSKLKPYLKKLD